MASFCSKKRENRAKYEAEEEVYGPNVASHQSVTYRYREFPVPGILNFVGGIGTGIGKNWYRKKVSEPVSGKFGTGKSLGTGFFEEKI